MLVVYTQISVQVQPVASTVRLLDNSARKDNRVGHEFRRCRAFHHKHVIITGGWGLCRWFGQQEQWSWLPPHFSKAVHGGIWTFAPRCCFDFWCSADFDEQNYFRVGGMTRLAMPPTLTYSQFKWLVQFQFDISSKQLIKFNFTPSLLSTRLDTVYYTFSYQLPDQVTIVCCDWKCRPVCELIDKSQSVLLWTEFSPKVSCQWINQQHASGSSQQQ